MRSEQNAARLLEFGSSIPTNAFAFALLFFQSS